MYGDIFMDINIKTDKFDKNSKDLIRLRGSGGRLSRVR